MKGMHTWPLLLLLMDLMILDAMWRMFFIFSTVCQRFVDKMKIHVVYELHVRPENNELVLTVKI